MNPIERLSDLFEKFPGIGPRQAERFVHFLLRASPSTRRDLAQAIQSLGGSVRQCTECMRFFSGDGSACRICLDSERDSSSLAIVAYDADLSALEASGTYRGTYFVLDGTISLAGKSKSLRLAKLLESIPKRKGLQEIILAFPASPEGDATAVEVREQLERGFPSLKITSLGRGLSTGSELEYADPETLRSALESRR